MSWFDRLPVGRQHFILSVAAVLLGYLVPYVEVTYTTWNLPPVLAGAVGALLPYAVAWATTFTTQYGYVGKAKATP